MPEPFIFFPTPTATQFKAVMSDAEILFKSPDLRVKRGNCDCHLMWHFETGAEHEFFYTECYTPQLWQLWLWVLDICLGNSTTVLHLSEDLRYESFYLVEYISDTEIAGWVWVQENRMGDELRLEYVNPDCHLRFQTSAETFINTLQNSLIQFFYNKKSYLHAFLYVDSYNLDFRHVTVREWPWGLFSQWYTQRHSIAKDMILKQLLGVFAQFQEHSFLFNMGRDTVDALAFEYAWTLMIKDLLCLGSSYDAQAFDALCKPITEFLDDTEAAWNSGELYGNFDEAVYDGYTEPEDREEKSHSYRTFLAQWRSEQLQALALSAPSYLLESCFHWNIILPRESKGAENA